MGHREEGGVPRPLDGQLDRLHAPGGYAVAAGQEEQELALVPLAQLAEGGPKEFDGGMVLK